MTSPYEKLIAAITEAGVPEAEARASAQRCAWSMAKQGGLGFAAGEAFAYFMAPVLASNPVTIVPYLGTAGAITAGVTLFGVGRALTKAPECSQVRDAIRYWRFTGI